VPAYNEEQRIAGTLAALAGQTRLDFTLVVVDNGSVDATRSIVSDFASLAPFEVVLLEEVDLGVGSAVETGFRFAIGRGAERIARTDADCLPQPGWLEAAHRGFDEGGELICGRIVARRDENGPLARLGFSVLVWVAATFGRLRQRNRGESYKTPYAMHAGNNVAITSELYLRCGGMPRMPSPTDRTFLNRVRAVTSNIVHRRDMVVENSTRRIRAYGVIASARWYLEKGAGSLNPDPR
jgi:glycosyltransferase involved in cell wall biosynthesis